jgi:hypothetical protein
MRRSKGKTLDVGEDPERQETEAQRQNRNLIELLQELRVAGLGVQVLLGFLLVIPFDTRFARLNSAQHGLYIGALLLAAIASALLSAPVAYHRLVFRRHMKAGLIRFANLMALLGLCAVALAVSAAILLVVSLVEPGLTGPVIAAVTVVFFAGLWFALPLSRRGQYESDLPLSRAAPGNSVTDERRGP